jgi:hypothetical protein
MERMLQDDFRNGLRVVTGVGPTGQFAHIAEYLSAPVPTGTL